MFLDSLSHHIPVQKRVIRQASSGFKSSSTWCTTWEGFGKSLWGKPPGSFETEKLVERYRAVSAVALPGTYGVVAVPETLPPGLFQGGQILVRSEYKDAEGAAVSFSRTGLDVLVVSAQPGIGKSGFLIWLLMRRLALELPTALQICSSHAILFHKGGVSKLAHTEIHPDYKPLALLSKNPSKRIWALIDSSPDLLEPSNIFKHFSPFFVVHVASHHSGHLDWVDEIGHKYFYMNSWSNMEVLQARPFLDKNCRESQLWYLHKEFGASPRDLANYAQEPVAYRSLLIRQILRMNPAILEAIVQNPGFLEVSHRLISIGPSEGDRGTFEKRFISQKVFDLIWDIHIRHHTNEVAHFYTLFVAIPGTKIAAGWLFEARMHELLAKDTTIRLFPIRHRTARVNIVSDNYDSYNNPVNPENFQLAWSEQHVLPEDDSVKLREGYYYRPASDTFPTIDSLLLLHRTGDTSPTLLMFQITRAEKHDVNPKGLDKVDGLSFPLDTRKFFVVVTPGDVRPTITVPWSILMNEPWTLVSLRYYTTPSAACFECMHKVRGYFNDRLDHVLRIWGERQ